MSANEKTVATEAESKEKIDWPVIAFFALTYAIAWGLILVFNAVAGASGVEDGLPLMAMTESLELEPIAGQLSVPGWFLYLLTRIQDFSFTIAGVIVTAVPATRHSIS